MGKKARDLAATVAALLLCLGIGVASADARDHRYAPGDPVPLYAAKIGPYYNPSETYRYYDFPFCSPGNITEKKVSLGEVLNGDRLVDTPYKLDFRIDHDHKSLCKKLLTKEDVARLRNAVTDDYYYQMFYDDLPIWGFVGRAREGKHDQDKYYIITHLQFHIFYNHDHVIELVLRTDQNDLVDITGDMDIEVEFLYSVKWQKTSEPFEKRTEKYITSYFHRWYSALNSCAVVLLVTAFLGTVLMRVLKSDLVNDDQEATGWKNIHGDVFRYPRNMSFFAACLGSGIQLFVLTISMFVLALTGSFPLFNRRYHLTSLLLIYTITSSLAGFIATSFYCQLSGTNWVRNLLLAACLFTVPLTLIFCFLNTIAIVYDANAALPFGTILAILLIWILVACPFLVLGGIVAKKRKVEFQAPCRTTKCPREIPSLSWYRRAIPQIVMAGVLPFGSIYIELYYIFKCMWGHRIYTTYGILFIVFIILLIVTAFSTVALTYFQLASEDYEWWWRSLFCGGSTGLYMYGYCFYYYARSGMSGLLQTSFFFGYMACICYGVSLMLGTVGFYASLLFVRHIYGSIKCD